MSWIQIPPFKFLTYKTKPAPPLTRTITKKERLCGKNYAKPEKSISKEHN